MRILLVSMRSIHFIRWTRQLQDAGHEVHWFDILNGGYINELDWVTQHTGWRYKGGNFKGRYFLKKKLPKVHRFLENDVAKAFTSVVRNVQPDVVHSFVLYKCCVPIFPVMKQFTSLPWIYSSWGSDLFYFKNIPEQRKAIEMVLPRIDYMFCDTQRDAQLARSMGFRGELLGVFPGGGGFHIDEIKKYCKSPSDRRLVLIKGYQGRSGRAIAVLETLVAIKDELEPYEVIVFGADAEVVDFLGTNPEIVKLISKVYTKTNGLSHSQVLELMGKSVVYIGNSNSDGMPNTLLESIITGAFPIQSNPGGASEEMIAHGKNGLLIQNHNDNHEIASHIKKALHDVKLRKRAYEHNLELRSKLDFKTIQQAVLASYATVEKQLS